MTNNSVSPQLFHQRRLATGLLLLVILVVVLRNYLTQSTPQPTLHQQQVRGLKIDLNRASRAELLQVPGVGPSLAEAILNHRRRVGEFRSIEDLDHVPGIGATSVEGFKKWLKVTPPASETELLPAILERKPDPPPPNPRSSLKVVPGDPLVNVNGASFEELLRLPGIGPTLAQRIIAERPFSSIDDLLRVHRLGKKTLEALRPYVKVRD